MVRRPFFWCLPLLMVGSVGAHASIFILNFNDLKAGEAAQGYYNGGFGSMGSGPGPSFGITLTNNFVTVDGGVFVPPPPLFPPSPFFGAEKLTGGSGTMDVAGGFSGPFSFYYVNSGADGTMNLYSGPDGAGSLVGTIPLPPVGGFSATGLVLAVPFESAVVTGTANTLTFDNLTFGAPLVIPEPASTGLSFTVLAAFAFVGRKSIAGRAKR